MRISSGLALTALLGILTCSTGFSDPATISIDCTKHGPRVNPHMYGIFFEELNHSGEGGLYAEMVKNRSFEDNNIPEGMRLKDGLITSDVYTRKLEWPVEKDPIPGWSSVNQPNAESTLTLDTDKPLNKSQITSLRLDIKEASPKSMTGAANTGFWGMAVKTGEKYDLSLFARCANGFKGKLVAVLEDANGKPLSDPTAISKIGQSWKKSGAALAAKGTSYNARLAIYADSPGTLWLDVVSLFPKNTYGHHPNGLRPDLVELLKDLHPGFMRFPGGCITEGLSLEQGYHWKNTIGPIEDRPGIWNSMWRYRRTDGLGYHELLQLCEDINTAPMYCLNVGVACTIHSPGLSCPMTDMQNYVDDAIDAIAYANDPKGTKWGDIRTKNGHAKPFNVKYINIGNELKGDDYTKRYPLFYNPIKARYPGITTIAYAGIGGTKAPIEIIDIHDYRDDKWFMENMNRFDTYDRSKPKISSTELAARNGTNHTLHNALLEAAYMIGLERNADVVQMVSYAPLFLNVNHPSPWTPDLIHFNNHQAYGTPSYYVQKLFMTNRPDVVLPTQVNTPDSKVYALAGKDEKTGEIIIKAVNLAHEPQQVNINLQGATQLGKEASVTVLTSKDEMDQNSFDDPKKVSPVTRTIKVDGPVISLDLNKSSLTVIRLVAKNI